MRWIALSFKQSRNRAEAKSQLDIDALYELAARYSPVVCWRQDQHLEHAGWLVEVHGSFRLFGGARALLSQLWACAEEFSAALHLANHHTATGAWWLGNSAPARSEDEFLDMLNQDESRLLALPLAVLDCEPKLQATWQQCGFVQLGDLRSLPRDGFLKRFGGLALAELDAGFGLQSKLAPGLPTHMPAEAFEQEEELPFHCTQLDLIEHHAQALLEAACRWLQRKKHGTRELQWRFKHAKGEESLCLRSAQAIDSQATWSRLLHHQLARMQFDEDIRSLRLCCGHTELLPNINASFLPDPSEGSRNWNSTCDVLRARLGEQTILFAATESDPRPECSIVLQHTPLPGTRGDQVNKKTGKHAVQHANQHATELNHSTLASSTPRPLWLLPTPKPLQGKCPSWQADGPWQLLSGPERVEFGWWDAQPCKRDYYCARDSNASVVWLYQDLLDENTRWFLHGYFA